MRGAPPRTRKKQASAVEEEGGKIGRGPPYVKVIGEKERKRGVSRKEGKHTVEREEVL